MSCLIRRFRTRTYSALALLTLLTGCSAAAPPAPQPELTPTATASAAVAATPTVSPSPIPTVTPTLAPTPSPVSPEPLPTAPPTAAQFSSITAMTTIGYLASLGPREATGPAFNEASAWVQELLAGWGYSVTVESFEVPAGNSWGVPVAAGTSHNLIADPQSFDPTAPHRVVGAHLDSVPQSPGAEDNASGVAVTLELARMISELSGPVPVRFIIFGAEEPRGEGDALHHFGSQHHVAELTDEGRAAVVSMVALDRVGVPAAAVPVGSGGLGTVAVREQLVAAAGEIPTEVREPNRASDHWSYDKAGIPAARLGSTPFSGYHSPGDVPSVVDPAQLERVGAIMWAWLRSPA